MQHIDLFSGIGGFALGARWAEIETIQFVEIDEFCQRVLRKNFPDIPIHNDIKTFKYEKKSDQKIIVTGGFPCQPFSNAGNKRGSKDERYLWPAMFKVIKDIKPDWCIIENVAGIINMALDKVLFDLESKDYEAIPFVIPACAIEADHRRDRVWIFAHNNGGGCKGEKISKESKGANKYFIAGQNSITPDTHHPAATRQRKHSGPIYPVPKPERSNNSNCFFANSCIKRLQGEFEKEYRKWQSEIQAGWRDGRQWHEVATEFCRVDDGISNRVDRLRGLGNTIMPQLAFIFFKLIKLIDLTP